MSQQQSGKSFRSFLGIEPSKPTTKDSVFVIIDAVSMILILGFEGCCYVLLAEKK